MGEIDKLIGERLGELLPRGHGPEQRARLTEFLKSMGWKEQTYYEARSGRRIFRISELAAISKASGIPVWRFLDARRTVRVGDDKKAVDLSSAELLELFSRPVVPGDKRRMLANAAKVIRTQVAQLVGLDAPPPEGGMAHQLWRVAMWLEEEGGSK